MKRLPILFLAWIVLFAVLVDWQNSRKKTREPAATETSEQVTGRNLARPGEAENAAEQAVLDFLSDRFDCDCSYQESGAIKYLWCDKQIGGGYHTYFVRDGAIYGKLGASIEQVVYKDGRINHNGGFEQAIREREREVK